VSTNLWPDFALAVLACAMIGAGLYARRLHRALAIAVFQAAHDPLTSLCNRRLLHPALDRCLTDERPFAVMIVDVDRFKQINDRYGHEAGDAVLVEIARRLERNLPGEVEGIQAVIRLGGDEFAIIVAGDDDHGVAAAKTLWRLIAGEPILLPEENQEVGVNVSVGVAARRLGDNGSTLLRRADCALAEVKRTGTSVLRWQPTVTQPTRVTV
jgi:diguanylate cyclase (GGDEF)-like protein